MVWVADSGERGGGVKRALARADPVQDDADAELTTLGFAELDLGLSLYDWQAKALLPLERATGETGRRVNLSICTPNGAGKDERLIPVAAYWWLFVHPRGKVVIISKSAVQLENQTIPSLEKHWAKFGWPAPIHSPRFELRTPTGGSLVAFVTNEAARVEGFHKEDDVYGPLLYIVNEAATVDEGMFSGVDRCTVSALMLVSKPGLKLGRFYDSHTKYRADFECTQVGLLECPHIPKEKIAYIEKIYGPDHPITRSTLHGEFMDQADGEFYCCTVEDVSKCLESPPRHEKGFKTGFFDFADGRAENVFVARDGNKYRIADAWRDSNEDAVVGRSIYNIRKAGLKPEECCGDAAAKSILDKMAAAGCAIRRQNFGAPDKSGIYASWGALVWTEGGKHIRDRDVIIEDDPVLIAQLTTRKKTWLPSGKLGVESKLEMSKRGLDSPDRADALFGCMAQLDASLMMSSKIIDISNWRSAAESAVDQSFLSAIGADAGN